MIMATMPSMPMPMTDSELSSPQASSTFGASAVAVVVLLIVSLLAYLAACKEVYKTQARCVSIRHKHGHEVMTPFSDSG
jgi:heme exporter protein D